MEGLIAEGEEVIEEGQELDDGAADLALFTAAQKVEHYEISATAPREPWQDKPVCRPPGALNKSLAEDEIADNLMTQLAREL